MGKTSIELPSHFSKTGFLSRSLIFLSNLSAKTAPKVVFLEYLLIFLLFRRLVKNLFTISDPLSVSTKFDFLLQNFRKFSEASFMD